MGYSNLIIFTATGFFKRVQIELYEEELGKGRKGSTNAFPVYTLESNTVRYAERASTHTTDVNVLLNLNLFQRLS